MSYWFYISKAFSCLVSTVLGFLYMLLWGIRFSLPVYFFGLPKFFKSRKGKIVLGKNIRLNSNYSSNLAGTWHPVSISAIGAGVIEIGNNTGISSSVIIAKKHIKIGDDVRIGVGCTICDTDFHPVDYKERMILQQEEKKAEVIIEDGVFLGMHTIVLKGVTIGKRSVIGAGSVVTKSIPPDVIAAGCPAKIIGHINVDKQ